jgi:SWI/SNF-related matrix-associated actin-dependent regulator 1 of chromatin subfamily A
MQLTYNRCILLTGTPINNNLPELLALLQFLLPDFFEGDGMQELHESCIRAEKSGPSQDKEKAAAGLVERIRALMDPFVLRRRKADVLGELVAKVDNVQMIEVGAAQRRIYDGILERWRRERAATTSDRKGREREGRTITSLFTELRKAANHPLLVRSRVTDKDLAELAADLHRREHFGDRCTREMVLKELQGYNDYEISHACQGYRALSRFVLPAAAVATSAKFDALASLLTDAEAGGHRVLIFSQWTSMLDLLEDFLGGRSVSFLRLDGSTPVKERQELIDEFNRDESILVFLLSTRAGGLGINLTAADTVILHDLDFNPQADRQAEDRCHRIGQTRPVHVHRLIARDTVDENIFRIADRKRRLADDMLGEGAGDIGDADADSGKEDESMQRIIESCLARSPSTSLLPAESPFRHTQHAADCARQVPGGLKVRSSAPLSAGQNGGP